MPAITPAGGPELRGRPSYTVPGSAAATGPASGAPPSEAAAAGSGGGSGVGSESSLPSALRKSFALRRDTPVITRWPTPAIAPVTCASMR